MNILSASGATPENERVISALRKALPDREFSAVAAWLSTFYGYQQNWILDQSRFSILLKCRQIGASHTYAGAAVLWGMLGEDTSIVSIGERESAEVLKKVARHADALRLLGSSWSKTKSASAVRVSFASGGSVMALPSTSGGRGQSGNVLLDEAAYFEHPQEVMDAAGGSVMHGYKLRLMSTPNGVGNMFHKAWVNAEKNGYRKHLTRLEDAMADGLSVNVDDCWKMAMGDPRIFSQLFGGSFLDGDLQYIPSGAIEACCVDDTGWTGGDCYAGLDIGRTSDRTELIIIRVDRETGARWMQYSEGCKRTSSEDLERLAEIAFKPPWNVRRLCVDASGMGTFPAEQLQKRYGRTKVEPVVFTMQVKEDLATCLYSAFTEKTIAIPRTDAALINDLRSIRRIITSAGNVRYDAPHTDEGHADKAWALALALHGCSGPDRRRLEWSGSGFG